MKQNIDIPAIDVKKYGGKQVAILDGEIIAFGNNLKEVLAKVKTHMPARPLREIKIFAVPRTLSVIYYVSSVSLRHHASRGRGTRSISGC